MIFGQNTTRYGWIDFLYLIRSRWPAVLLVCSLVLLGGAAVRSRSLAVYESVARIGIETPVDSSEAATVEADFRRSGQNDLIRAGAELRSDALLSEVIKSRSLAERWEIRDEEALLKLLASRVRVEIRDEEQAILLGACDLSPQHAATLANALVDRFIERKDSEARAEANARVRRFEQEIETREREITSIEARLVEIAESAGGATDQSVDLRRQLVSARNVLHSLEAKRQLAVLEADHAATTVRRVDPATSDRSVAMMPMWLTLPGLLGIGLLAGIGFVLVTAASVSKNRWEAISALIARLQIHFAGFVPLSGGLAVASGELPASLLEPYRDLRNRLLRLPVGDCLLLTVMPQRKSDPAAEAIVNLAAVLADAGRTTLVIDADFRSPSLHPYFEAAHHPGLSDFLSGEMRLEETVIRSRRANLWFMPAGPLHDDPGGLLNGRRMDDLVWDMRSRFDFILIASPSIHELSDAGVLASLADFTAVVTPYASHSLRRLRETQIALEMVNAPLSCVMLTTPLEGSHESAIPAREESAPTLAAA